MDNRPTVWDPLRKKEVALTPEERVRQWFISVLSSRFGCPHHMMMSEAGFKLGGKQFRADILVYDRKMKPVVVVECKRPEVPLANDVLDQAVRYNMVLNVRYIVITNGPDTVILHRYDDNGGIRYAVTDTLPDYNEMTV